MMEEIKFLVTEQYDLLYQDKQHQKHFLSFGTWNYPDSDARNKVKAFWIKFFFLIETF